MDAWDAMAESVHSVRAAMVTGQGRADGHPTIFISRAGADTEVAGIFGEILEAAGFPVVLQQWDFGSGSFIEHMHAGLVNDSVVLAVLSQSYLASPYCAAEWQAALAPDPLNRKGRLVLLRIDDCVPTGLLGPMTYWDAGPVLGDPTALRALVLAALGRPERKAGTDWLTARYRDPVTHPSLDRPSLFVGRDRELAKIAEYFDATDEEALRPLALTGIDGIGKTALARRYAWDSREQRGGIWIADASSPARLEKGVCAAAEAAAKSWSPPTGEQDSRAAAQEAMELLGALAQSGRRWLLILDGAPAPNALDWLRMPAGLDLLITSPWSDWSSFADSLALSSPPREEAAEMVMLRSGQADVARGLPTSGCGGEIYRSHWTTPRSLPVELG